MKTTFFILSFLLLSLLMDSHVESTPIVNGRPAIINQFPFAVVFAIYDEVLGSYKRFCGGTLVDETTSPEKSTTHLNSHFSWALSAAHCFVNSNIRNRTIYFATGGGDIQRAKWQKVEAIFIAEMNVYTLQNDIALIKMKSRHHHVIVRRAGKFSHISRRCRIYGYGKINENLIGSFPNRLRYAGVMLISFEKCTMYLGRVTAPIAGSGQFCAMGRQRADACSGDSGSGLVCGATTDEGRLELVGITSYGGTECKGSGGSVGVYISVAHHKNWIDSVIAKCSRAENSTQE